MSREIKFRAWIPELNKMVQVVSHNFDVGGTYFKDFNGREGFINKGVILREFIGLKDKNGNEIYEGDIVKIKHTYEYPTMEGYARDWTTTIGEVAYVHAGFDIKRINRDGVEVWQGITAMECLTDMLSEWKVVGNIYENPELLEGTV